jgi:hypothetical protein
MPETPIFARIAVIAAKNADKSAQNIHVMNHHLLGVLVPLVNVSPLGLIPVFFMSNCEVKPSQV